MLLPGNPSRQKRFTGIYLNRRMAETLLSVSKHMTYGNSAKEITYRVTLLSSTHHLEMVEQYEASFLKVFVVISEMAQLKQRILSSIYLLISPV